ncbi:hypothetical protein K505DRAFT_294994 [Melanomma pulvis-pyrius CBS 109.77]|uniref:Uncharacterized protein n=1 Tax=Melanomma pulvis-pyrius CBS 109.77 TaxID=1314802 RepID=A0A6A6XT42_9PLEO|nr:hypothetical protein K505DRAFT_294994 [Melanomma pulvis-pyrius CBS 109.77]
MEPRIATLLGDAALASDRTTVDPISLLPPPRRPLPVEPTPVGDDGRSNSNPTRRSEYDYLAGEHHGWPAAPPPPQSRVKSGVPIAEVLNDEEPQADQATALAARFSGRLSDILLDPSKQHPNKRRKLDGHTTPPAVTSNGNENNPLKLPRLPQLPKKTTRRPRIPPLLQGLHQPPPLPPEGRLFPPITGETGGFGRNIGERVGLRTPPEVGRNRRDREGDNEVEREISSAAASNRTTGEKEQEKNRRPAPKYKKRNRWSEQETKDLLQGVSKFGIGSWKKILEWPDFNFDHRTAVDLKDRFRTCCPGQAEKENEVASFYTSNSGEGPGLNKSPMTVSECKHKQPRKPRGDTHKKTEAELVEMGIERPFEPSKRRRRREFTEEDDQNLLKGHEKYKCSWHAMRDDKDLGFNSRHPTDLRDRFRIRYPELYQKAGYRLKPKEQLLFPKDKGETNSQESASSGASGGQRPDTPKKTQSLSSPDGHTTIPAITTTSSSSNLRAHTLRQPLLNSFPSPFEDFPDVNSEDDEGEGGRSPITLNRNIFQWADANPSQANTTAASAYLTTGDAGFNLFAGMDGYHINPLATLKLPAASITNNGLSAMPSYPPTSNPLALSFPSNSTVHTTTNMGMNMINTNPLSSLLRTPNLPTIVFPHVPVSSARNAMHNLPPPADLLSGLDLDMRTEAQQQQQQHLGYFIDDGSGSGVSYASSSTLAPLMGQVGGAGIVRGVWDEFERRGF